MEFQITTTIRNEEYSYSDDNVKVTGNFSYEIASGDIKTIGGTVVSVDGGAFIGNFNGYNNDGSIKYSISDIPSEDTANVLGAIENIAQSIHKDFRT